MILAYLKQINWVDIFVVILLIRTCYIAIKTGFPTEMFKLLGTACATYLAWHYYISIGGFLNSRLPLEGELWVSVLNMFAFFVLALIGYLIFAIIRVLFTMLIRMEAISLLNRWGAFILGVARWGLLASLLFSLVSISNISYLKISLLNSLSGPRLVKLAPRVYTFLWNNLMSRFTDKEAFNKAVFPVEPDVTE